MKIANPIYDIAFKYLMEDLKIAKGIIARIINREILEIDFKPTEYVTYIDFLDGKAGKAMRMDFHAIILNKTGEKQKVLIELQKSKKSLELKRFRNYLGDQYRRPDNIIIKRVNDKDVEVPEYYPIITIYLLGYLEDKNLPAIVEIDRVYRDVKSEQVINGYKNEFIEKLTHNSYIIQLTKLDESVQTPLDRILTIFDQKKQTKQREILEYPDEESEKFSSDALLQRAIKRLAKAVLEEKLRKDLEFEEEMEETFSNIIEELKENKKALKEKDKVLKEKNKVLEEKDKVLKESKIALEEKDKVLEEKDRLIAELMKKVSHEKE